ncbi:transporter [Methylomonas sp. LL1]|uniref:SphA family protein n=1 Tax=Methylomonas sp. LL1 TaxID=2785785 RepID=UPI0018C3C035|nr:transporter [Methylomonas sp. LL1]QPK64856.1 transporter [Methylomonas sp. LL1]
MAWISCGYCHKSPSNSSRPLRPSALVRYLLIAALCWHHPSVTRASEGGGTSYLPGFYGDFGMAYITEPGTYFNNLFGYYTTQDSQYDYSIAFDMPSILHVSDLQILGGAFTVGMYPMLLRSEYSVPSSDIDTRRGGFGDFYVVPGGISWQWDNFYLFVYEGVNMPTGSYRQDRSLNAGRNYWSLDNNASLTWMSGDGRFELSMNIGYMLNSENPATDYRTGDEFHLDYLLGYYPIANFGIGINGSVYRQVTADSGSGAAGATLLSEANTIGPALYFNQKLGGQEIMWSAKWLHEFDANSYTAGDYVMLHTFFKF